MLLLPTTMNRRFLDLFAIVFVSLFSASSRFIFLCMYTGLFRSAQLFNFLVGFVEIFVLCKFARIIECKLLPRFLFVWKINECGTENLRQKFHRSDEFCWDFLISICIHTFSVESIFVCFKMILIGFDVDENLKPQWLLLHSSNFRYRKTFFYFVSFYWIFFHFLFKNQFDLI